MKLDSSAQEKTEDIVYTLDLIELVILWSLEIVSTGKTNEYNKKSVPIYCGTWNVFLG